MYKHFRQGDLIFSKVDQVVEGKKGKQITVAEGGFTGHQHVLVAETGSHLIGDINIFEVKGKARLIHPEHGTLNFGPGVYIVSKEREFDYIENSLKVVRD